MYVGGDVHISHIYIFYTTYNITTHHVTRDDWFNGFRTIQLFICSIIHLCPHQLVHTGLAGVKLEPLCQHFLSEWSSACHGSRDKQEKKHFDSTVLKRLITKLHFSIPAFMRVYCGTQWYSQSPTNSLYRIKAGLGFSITLKNHGHTEKVSLFTPLHKHSGAEKWSQCGNAKKCCSPSVL